MGPLILIVLLLAALTGVFWTVLKVTAIAILSLILTIVVLVYAGVWYAKRRFRTIVNDPRIQQHLRQHQQGQGGSAPGGGAVTAQGWKQPDEPLPPD